MLRDTLTLYIQMVRQPETHSRLDSRCNKQGQGQSLLKDRASCNQSNHLMELPVNNGDESEMDSNGDVS